jgi:hypothetical protein
MAKRRSIGRRRGPLVVGTDAHRDGLEGRTLSLQKLTELLEGISQNFDPVVNLFQIHILQTDD